MIDTLSTAAQTLSHKRILVTRAAERADGLVGRLRELGAEPVVCPLIAHAPPEDEGPLEAALRRLAEGAYAWVVFTSATAVQAVAARLASRTLHPTSFQAAAVGPATAAACVELLGLAPARVPERFLAEDLAAALGDLSGARVLLPNADIARPTLEDRLRAGGALVERVVAYRTVPAPPGDLDLPALLRAGAIDAILLTSGSTARALVQRLGPEGLAAARAPIIACIGPSTAAACREAGLTPTVVAEVSTEIGLVAALDAYCREPSR